MNVIKHAKAGGLLKPKNQNKRHIEGVNPDTIINKDVYSKEVVKLTDRFIPKLNSFRDLEYLLNDFAGDIKL
jgi:hypothetical protein